MAANRTGLKTGSKKFALTSSYQLATLTVVLCKRLQAGKYLPIARA